MLRVAGAGRRAGVRSRGRHAVPQRAPAAALRPAAHRAGVAVALRELFVGTPSCLSYICFILRVFKVLFGS